MMEKVHSLRAGAGRAQVAIAPCLPLDSFTAVHDAPAVRALVLDGDKRIVIVSVEITSVFPETQKQMTDSVCAIAGVPQEHVWLTLTHCFGLPHIWPTPSPGEPERSRPGHPPRSQDEIERCDRLGRAYLSALESAVGAAVNNLTDAVIGAGRGECAVNISRSMLTPDGWWLGADSEGHCDRSLNVLRIDGADGGNIALLYVYGVRSCVADRVKGADGGKVVTTDLAGCASRRLENEFGDGFAALFLCGAAGDQEPVLKGCTEILNKDGELCQEDIGDGAFTLLEAQGRLLASETLRVWANITDLGDVDSFGISSADCVLETKHMNRDLRSLRPTKVLSFERDGEKRLTVYGLRLGDLCLVGVQPELDGVTTEEIAAAFPGQLTATAIMINGCDKCMPEAEAYEVVKYQCQNSPFMPGSAEKLRDTARSLITTLRKGN